MKTKPIYIIKNHSSAYGDDHIVEIHLDKNLAKARLKEYKKEENFMIPYWFEESEVIVSK